VVNEKYAEDWYRNQECTEANKCPAVCCPVAMSVECVDGQCTVVTGEEAP
jgi:hypothetical protein